MQKPATPEIEQKLAHKYIIEAKEALKCIALVCAIMFLLLSTFCGIVAAANALVDLLR